MRLNLLADYHWESGLERALNEISDLGYRGYFAERNYGEGLVGITVVYVCQDPALNLSRRVRHSKREKKIYMDAMLDLPAMKALDHEARKRVVINRLMDEVPNTVQKYKIADFDSVKFISDLREWCVASGLA